MKTALGLILVAAGIACVAWGVTEMRTLKSRFWREVGRPDYTAPLVTGGGAALAVLGIALALKK